MGPEEFHLVLLDNGRTRVLRDPVGRQALHCIRCSACLNICPVYSRVGGHAYHATYPGPIGSILTPQLLGPGIHDTLPFASTLCGACREVCPVRIDIPRVLLYLRGRVVEGPPRPGRKPRQEAELGPSARAGPTQEGLLMGVLGMVLRSPRKYRWGLWLARKMFRGRSEGGWIGRLPGYGSGWTRGRDFPALPEASFRDWWGKREIQATHHPDSPDGGSP